MNAKSANGMAMKGYAACNIMVMINVSYNYNELQEIKEEGNMTNLFRIGERLAWLRENSGYSQEALAERLGCCAITISRWGNGHTSMKVMDIVKIVDISKCFRKI